MPKKPSSLNPNLSLNPFYNIHKGILAISKSNLSLEKDEEKKGQGPRWCIDVFVFMVWAWLAIQEDVMVGFVLSDYEGFSSGKKLFRFLGCLVMRWSCFVWICVSLVGLLFRELVGWRVGLGCTIFLRGRLSSGSGGGVLCLRVVDVFICEWCVLHLLGTILFGRRLDGVLGYLYLFLASARWFGLIVEGVVTVGFIRDSDGSAAGLYVMAGSIVGVGLVSLFWDFWVFCGGESFAWTEPVGEGEWVGLAFLSVVVEFGVVVHALFGGGVVVCGHVLDIACLLSWYSVCSGCSASCGRFFVRWYRVCGGVMVLGGVFLCYWFCVRSVGLLHTSCFWSPTFAEDTKRDVLLRATGSEGCKTNHEEMETWEWDKVNSKLPEIRAFQLSQ
ncbi:hypothetical protein Tco_1033238 [Tanacetum coccineum]|uniref:Transmembrane protein n=1 Tax=Tanacetum coccineum TaxID=301880 RepID=A0ABQ5GE38_9ASTR